MGCKRRASVFHREIQGNDINSRWSSESHRQSDHSSTGCNKNLATIRQYVKSRIKGILGWNRIPRDKRQTDLPAVRVPSQKQVKPHILRDSQSQVGIMSQQQDGHIRRALEP